MPYGIRQAVARYSGDAGGADHARHRVTGQFGQLQIAAAEFGGELAGEAETDHAAFAVDDHGGHGVVSQLAGGGAGARDGVGAAGGAAVGEQDQEGAAVRVAGAFAADDLAGLQEALGQWGFAAGAEVRQAADCDIDRRCGGRTSSASWPRMVITATLSRLW